jgi:hypothetical protein
VKCPFYPVMCPALTLSNALEMFHVPETCT